MRTLLIVGCIIASGCSHNVVNHPSPKVTSVPTIFQSVHLKTEEECNAVYNKLEKNYHKVYLHNYKNTAYFIHNTDDKVVWFPNDTSGAYYNQLSICHLTYFGPFKPGVEMRIDSIVRVKSQIAIEVQLKKELDAKKIADIDRKIEHIRL